LGTVIVFAGGEPPPPRILDDMPLAELSVAADGGMEVARALGHPVDVLVGDLDSVDTSTVPSSVMIIAHPRDKDATDLELALELVMRDSPERVVVVGGAGGRVDHELATAGLLCSPRWEAVDEIDWLTGRGRAHVVRRRRRLHGDVGDTLSLLPFGGDAEGVSTKGLAWELADETLSQGSTRGVSNLLVSPVVDIGIRHGVVLAVFPEG
jgi:thiamine pyrophosphokinase